MINNHFIKYVQYVKVVNVKFVSNLDRPVMFY